jgi:hypothetical protein
MAVMVVGEAVGLTKELLEGMLAKLSEPMRRSPGFIALLTGPQPQGEGWRVMEIWETTQDASRWFAEFVHPNLPPGIKPKRAYYELSAVVLKESAGA